MGGSHSASTKPSEKPAKGFMDQFKELRAQSEKALG